MRLRMEAHWEKRGQHWTRSRLIAEIRRHHRAGVPLRITVAPVKLVRAGQRLFGSWKAAVEKAGLHYDDLLLLRRWSREKVIEMIQKLAGDGVPINGTHIRRRYPFLFAAAIVQFPSSWGKALRAAGFDPDEHKKRRGRWDKQKAEDWVRKRVENRRSILVRDVPGDLKDFAQYHIDGGWSGFVESLGIPYPGKKDRRWTKELVLNEIRRWDSNGQAMHYSAMKRQDSNLLKKAIIFYGSWDRARTAAGARKP